MKSNKLNPKEKFLKNRRAHFRFDTNYDQMLSLLAVAHGCTKTAVVEMAIQNEYNNLMKLSQKTSTH